MCPVFHPQRTEKRNGRRLRLATYRIKCTLWSDSPPQGPNSAFGFAADVSETGMGLYTDLDLPKGTILKIAFEGNENDVYRGVVAWSHLYTLQQGFHGRQAFDHRIGLHFLFASEAERQRHIMYLNELRQKVTSQDLEYRF